MTTPALRARGVRYDMHIGLRQSDHRPVFASYDMPVPVDPDFGQSSTDASQERLSLSGHRSVSRRRRFSYAYSEQSSMSQRLSAASSVRLSGLSAKSPPARRSVGSKRLTVPSPISRKSLPGPPSLANRNSARSLSLGAAPSPESPDEPPDESPNRMCTK